MGILFFCIIMLAIESRSGMVAALEEFDKVRDIGKGTVSTYLRDCLSGR